jgi:uncharacterized membrane protein
MMKNLYKILALTGAILWAASIFLRETSLMDYSVIRHFLWVAPNIAAVWMGIGFTFMLYPHIFKKEFDKKYLYALIGAILAVLLFSEIIHHVFLDSPFDIWDMVASLAASIIIIIVRFFETRREK